MLEVTIVPMLSEHGFPCLPIQCDLFPLLIISIGTSDYLYHLMAFPHHPLFKTRPVVRQHCALLVVMEVDSPRYASFEIVTRRISYPPAPH